MIITYQFSFDEGQEISHAVDLDRAYDPVAARKAPVWTKLGNNQCQNCPLSAADHANCPAAVDLDGVIRGFQSHSAATKLNVRVVTPEREYLKRVTLEEGIRALMGLVMATSACPVFGTLKPNARHHLPFARQEEYILRSVSLYLMRQYLVWREGGTPDWELKGLVKNSEQLQLVNHAFWQRIMTEFQSDANSKALLSFFTMSSSVSSSLQSQITKMKKVFFTSD
jgi:hypothetical protein